MNLRTILLPVCVLLAIPTLVRGQSTIRYTPTGGAPYAISGTRSDSDTLTCTPDLLGQDGPISTTPGFVSRSPSLPADAITAAGGDPNVVFDVMNDQSLFQGSSSVSFTDIFGIQHTTSISVSGKILTTTEQTISNRTTSDGVETFADNLTDKVVTTYDIVTGQATSTWTFSGSSTGTYSQTVQGQTEQCVMTDVPNIDATGSGVWSINMVPVNTPRFSPTEKADFEEASVEWNITAQFFEAIEVSPLCLLFPECEVIEGADFLFADAASIGFDILAMDPADSNFTVIPQPVFLPVPALPQGSNPTLSREFNALAQNLGKQSGYFGAISTAINRAQGAEAASNVAWQQNQLLAAKSYAYQLFILQTAEPGLRSNLLSDLQSAGAPSIQVGPPQVDAVIQNVTQNGLPSSTVSSLTSLGFSSAAISNYQSAIGSLKPTSTLTFPNLLTDPSILARIKLTQGALGQFAADRNGDLLVNCADLDIVKASFGKRTGQIGFDPRADVNGDGLVSVLDLSFIAQQLTAGTVCQ
jgi:hypothetical protein